MICAAAVQFSAVCSPEDLKLHPDSEFAVQTALEFNQDDFALDYLASMGSKKCVRVDKRALPSLRSQHFGVKALSDSAHLEMTKCVSLKLDRPSLIIERKSERGDESMLLDESVYSESVSPLSLSSSSTLSMSASTDSETLTVLSKIARVGDLLFPICTLPGSKRYNNPNKCRSLQRRGLKVTLMSHAPGNMISSVVTYTDRKCQLGHFLYQMSPKFWAVFRSVKGVNELNLAMEKETRALLPGMVDLRERLIDQYIVSNNSLYKLQEMQGKIPTVQILTRDSIKMEKFRMLKTMDGCGERTKCHGETNRKFQ